MMNKGLEVIEACWLFDTDPESVEVVIHPQSVIHSMVEYEDGSVLAQLGSPDMRTPIAHGLAWPDRFDSGSPPLDLAGVSRLDFDAPDMERFPCLRLGFEAARAGGAAPTVLNAANEVAVGAFLDRGLRFTDIVRVVEETMSDISVGMWIISTKCSKSTRRRANGPRHASRRCHSEPRGGRRRLNTMDFLYSAVAFIVTLGILITVHEYGHFWVARRLGIKVLRFSVGFGRALWSRRLGRDGTEYVVAMVPLGGYVKMLDESEGNVAEHELHRAFNRQKLATRVAVVAAGPRVQLPVRHSRLLVHVHGGGGWASPAGGRRRARFRRRPGGTPCR